MIYTFSFDSKFINSFKDDLNTNNATLIFNFINQNFIKRDNFYLKVEGKRKGFFNINTNGGNGSLLKTMLTKLNRKYKNFPKKLMKTDYIFSNHYNKAIETISFKKIFKEHILLEENLDNSCKPFWQRTNAMSDQANKRNLAKVLERVIDHSDEVFLVDRHVPRTICKSKCKSKGFNDERYASSYLNSFEFYNSIIKNKQNKNRFYCGLLKKDLNKFVKEGLNVKDILKDSFSKFVNSKLFVHILSKYDAYDKLHERLIIGLINNEFFVMLRTEKGLNILDENNKLNKDNRKFDFVREEIALDDWQDWNLTVRHSKPDIEFVIN